MQRWNLLTIAAPDGARTPSVLHSNDSARALLIALRPGESLGDHQVKEHAWIVVVDGEVVFGSGGDEEPGRAGTLLRFDPDERHSVRSENGARLLILLAPWPGEGHYRGDE